MEPDNLIENEAGVAVPPVIVPVDAPVDTDISEGLSHVRTGALMLPADGTREAYKVLPNQIFFRHEFRPAVETREARLHA